MIREPGFARGTIVEHRLEHQKAKDRVVITMDLTVDGEPEMVQIYITDKSADFAVKQLAMCGFNALERSISALQNQPKLLAGRIVPLMFEEYPEGSGQIRPGIMVSTPPTEEQCTAADNLLRSAGTKKPAGSRAAAARVATPTAPAEGDMDWYEG